MAAITGTNVFTEKLLNTLRDMQGEGKALQAGVAPEGDKKGGASFADHLKQGIAEVNGLNVKADRLAMELQTGKTGNIHETMLAATQAELSFNLMVQIRNKALEAYSEIMKMPV
jgi:flagellar hook-basal body complex protein FliE